MTKMKRPELQEIPISDALNRGVFLITMSVNQWDQLLQSGYDAGAVLLELDANEMPVRAYRKGMNA